MQQTKSYWRVVVVAGALGAFVASACVVTTSTDDGIAGGAGTIGSAGTSTSTAGTSAGGTTGTSGSSGIAGTNSLGGTTAGGAPATSFQCDPSDGKAVGTPASCAATQGNTCSECTATNCCSEFGACFATSPGNQCGYGGPNSDGEGEIFCVLKCIQAATGDGGVPDDPTIGTCANACITPKDSANTACTQVIGAQTSDLVGCLNKFCQPECFGG